MQLLEVHAITGLLGVLIESAFNAKKITNPDENFSLLLGFNEINWIINESFIVAYSYMKLETAVFNESLKKALRITLGFIFVPFAKLRINIGVLRVQFNVTNNEQISFAHSLAFIPWGFAELIIFGLLMFNIYQSLKWNIGIRSILNSSIPRLLVMTLNTFGIVIVGQFNEKSELLNSINDWLWMTKGAYSIILLVDLFSFKHVLQNDIFNESEEQSAEVKTKKIQKSVNDKKNSTTKQEC